MTECHTQIHESEPWLYNAPRQHDFFLMDIVLRSGIPDDHQEIFNRIRINLRLITASDVVVVDSGTKLLPYLYDGMNR